MKRIRTCGILLLLLTLLLSGCSKESLMDYGSELLDRMFVGESNESKAPSEPPSSLEQETASPPAVSEPEDSGYPEAVEPTIPSSPEPEQKPETKEETPVATSEGVTPSHTDVTLFGPGESFSYLPKGVSGVYACEYASDDDSIAAVDSATGTVTAVGPGTTNITMHVEYNGQYDFKCIVRCNWKNDEQQADTASETSEPALPSEPAVSNTPAAGTVTASHSDATFFNPKEYFHFVPLGVGDDYSCAYSTKDASVATVDEKGTVTAVGPGTTTVTMLIDAGGTEYTFECIVRCSWS